MTRGTVLSQVETEILEEAASSLGHYGRAAEAALARLKGADAGNRPALLQNAADAVWAFLIQREFCGMRDHRFIIREMDIPRSVLNRMGAIRRKKVQQK
ncbi:MAG: hypothetical protein KKH72_11410 [Alphaproteobacteria bacterium]|nr:hypothetical protein [Alphaproteobacteria bacterium]